MLFKLNSMPSRFDDYFNFMSLLLAENNQDLPLESKYHLARQIYGSSASQPFFHQIEFSFELLRRFQDELAFRNGTLRATASEFISLESAYNNNPLYLEEAFLANVSSLWTLVNNVDNHANNQAELSCLLLRVAYGLHEKQSEICLRMVSKAEEVCISETKDPNKIFSALANLHIIYLELKRWQDSNYLADFNLISFFGGRTTEAKIKKLAEILQTFMKLNQRIVTLYNGSPDETNVCATHYTLLQNAEACHAALIDHFAQLPTRNTPLKRKRKEDLSREDSAAATASSAATTPMNTMNAFDSAAPSVEGNDDVAEEEDLQHRFSPNQLFAGLTGVATAQMQTFSVTSARSETVLATTFASLAPTSAASAAAANAYASHSNATFGNPQTFFATPNAVLPTNSNTALTNEFNEFAQGIVTKDTELIKKIDHQVYIQLVLSELQELNSTLSKTKLIDVTEFLSILAKRIKNIAERIRSDETNFSEKIDLTHLFPLIVEQLIHLVQQFLIIHKRYTSAVLQDCLQHLESAVSDISAQLEDFLRNTLVFNYRDPEFQRYTQYMESLYEKCHPLITFVAPFFREMNSCAPNLPALIERVDVIKAAKARNPGANSVQLCENIITILNEKKQAILLKRQQATTQPSLGAH